MRYEIILAPQASEDLLQLRASDRAKALDAIEKYLRHEPEKVSKSRIKRLEGLAWPQYRLRIDDLRAFYDVFYKLDQGVVEVLAVLEKSEAMKWLAEYGRQSDVEGSTE